jgi:hypothetical protein
MDACWAPDLGSGRLLSDGRSIAVLRPDSTVQWWCAPDVDGTPLCWQLLDGQGASAGFEHLGLADWDQRPAGGSARTVLRAADGRVEVRDALLAGGGGVLLVRLVRAHPSPDAGPVSSRPARVVHTLRLGGFGAEPVELRLDGALALGEYTSRGQRHRVAVRAAAHELRGATLHSRLEFPAEGWTALVVAVDCDDVPDTADLVAQVHLRDADEQQRLRDARLPRSHPDRARDALAVLRACTYAPTGAVVASPTTSVPEAPGHDRQFDYRYTWLRDASLSTAVAALLGQSDDARSYLDFVHRAWADTELLDAPVLDVRGRAVPQEQTVDGVRGWAGSRPVRTGNAAGGQRQYDALGLLVEAVSVHVQVGGELDARTWALVRRLADDVARDPERVEPSNGIWELRDRRPLVDGDLGRWLVLDRALWMARGWRPWTRRRHWKRARDVIAARVLGAIDDRGLLPQAYGGQGDTPDASALMAVAFGLLGPDDPRAGRLVDGLLAELGAGPYLYRYRPGPGDGFSGEEGAFLPMSFLAVTALAQLGRVDEARRRLDRMCSALPPLLGEEVDPATHRVLGNTPLVWTHAELARALYVLDAARIRSRWGTGGLWAWRIHRYLSLRRQQRGGPAAICDHQEE